MLSILTNVMSAGAGRSLDRTQLRLDRHAARLASGLRINSARDDAAGLAIASRLQARRRGMDVDLRSLNDLTSLAQVADSALESISDNLQRIRVLAIQAANGTNQNADRQALQLEANQLIDASRRIQAMTEFNGQRLLDGSFQSDAHRAGGSNLPTLSIAQLFLSRTTDTLLRYVQMGQASTTVTASGGGIQAGDLRINGKAIPASVAGAGPGQNAGSAWAIAAAINQAGITGLTATANAAQLTGDPTLQPNGGNVLAGDIVINGVPCGAGNVINAINSVAAQTGVTAHQVAGAQILGQTPYTLVLSSNDGRDFDVAGAAGFGLNDGSAVGSVSIQGPLAEGGNLSIGGANPGGAGLAAGVIDGVSVGDPVPVPLTEDEGYDFNPNLMSEDGAQATIGVMDRKLDKLLAIRTKLGATLNALEVNRDHLTISRETAAATISRIEDADYAVEMAALTREKILQEAALAMCAQANAQSQRLLTLLLDNMKMQPQR